MTDSADLPAADQQAIGKALLTLLRSLGDRDADALHAGRCSRMPIPKPPMHTEKARTP
ncbi:MAG TPA: hypothetical protein VE400_20380 [Mycobacterium sp.]|nr:hypothetical protein [Mycobacterium sp.]